METGKKRQLLLTREEMILKPGHDVAIVAVSQCGERIELLAGESSMARSMLKARLDRPYDSDPRKDFFLVKRLQCGDSSMLLQCWKGTPVPISVCTIGASEQVELFKCGWASD